MSVVEVMREGKPVATSGRSQCNLPQRTFDILCNRQPQCSTINRTVALRHRSHAILGLAMLYSFDKPSDQSV